MTRLYSLSAEYAALQDAAAEGEDVGAQLDALNEALEQKAQNIVFVLRGLEGDDEALTSEIKRLTERRDRVRKSHDKLRDYISQCMQSGGITRIQSARVTITLSDGPESVEVVDEGAVPETYVRTKREVNKRAVLDAWKQLGECIAGTEVKRSKVLKIR